MFEIARILLTLIIWGLIIMAFQFDKTAPCNTSFPWFIYIAGYSLIFASFYGIFKVADETLKYINKKLGKCDKCGR